MGSLSSWMLAQWMDDLEETEKLRAEFPDECFRTGAGGKDNLIYIEHYHLRTRLDEVLGMGQAVLVPRNVWTEEYKFFKDGKEKIGVRVYVMAMFVVRGCYVTEAVGEMTYYPGNPGADYSDAVEGAETAALRRCCKKFGVGLQAWSKTWCEGWWRRKGTQTPLNQSHPGEGDRPESHGPMPACPKCGKTDSVIIGKAEYGGGFLCWKKAKVPGCGHKWDGKDVRTGQDAAPAQEYPPLIAEWQKKLDPSTVGIGKLNGSLLEQFKAIPGKNPDRAKVWKMIERFAASYNHYLNRGTGLFEQRQVGDEVE